jgi:hypothetical protein
MSIKFNRSQTFATNGTVTAAGLHNLVDGLDIYQALITDQTSLTAVAPEDSILIADASLTAGDAPRQTTVSNLFDDALTSGTYTNINLTGSLTYGTATGNSTVSTSAVITNGTIPNLTAGTTNSTVGIIPNFTAGTTISTSANITNGTIQSLTSSTATITGGTFSGSVNSSLGTIGTLNSTTGTIGNLSTTLVGDLAISQGTSTLATSGVSAGTYGTNTIALRLGVDAKGRITTISTSDISSTPADGSITFAKLSTSSTDADNTSKRVAKGWVNFNGSTDTIRGSFNVHSVSHPATGEYTVNFNTSIGTGMSFSADGNLSSSFNYVITSDVSSATSIRVIACTTGAVKTNIDYLSVIVFGT